MAQGQASTIFFELPGGLKSAFGEGEIPKEFIEKIIKVSRMLPESERKEVLGYLKRKGMIK